MRFSSSSIFSPCISDVEVAVSASFVKSGQSSFFLAFSAASVIKLKLDILELSEGLIVVLERNGFRLFSSFIDVFEFEVAVGEELNEGFSFLFNIGGVSVSKLENGKLESGVVVDDVHVDEKLASVFIMVPFDEDDEDVDRL